MRDRWSRWQELVEASGATIFAAAASVVALALTARALGPEGRGYFASLTGWVFLASSLGSLSIGQVIVSQISGKPHVEWIDEVLGSSVALILLSSVVCWSALAAVYLTGVSEPSGVGLVSCVVAFAALPLLMWNDNGRYVMFSLDQVRTYGRALILGHSANVVVLGAAVAVGRLTLDIALASWALTYVAVAVVTMRGALRQSKAPRFSGARVRSILRGSGRLHLTTVATFVQLQASVLIVAFYRGAREAGLYQLAVQIVSIGTLLPLAASIVCYRIVSTNGPDSAWAQQRRLVGWTMAAMLAAIPIGYVLTPLAVDLVAGPEFGDAVPAVRVMLGALAGMGLSMMMASQWIARGLFIQTSAISVAAALLSLVADFLLIPRYGLMGATVSTLLVYGAAMMVNGAFALRIERRWRTAQASI